MINHLLPVRHKHFCGFDDYLKSTALPEVFVSAAIRFSRSLSADRSLSVPKRMNPEAKQGFISEVFDEDLNPTEVVNISSTI